MHLSGDLFAASTAPRADQRADRAAQGLIQISVTAASWADTFDGCISEAFTPNGGLHDDAASHGASGITAGGDCPARRCRPRPGRGRRSRPGTGPTQQLHEVPRGRQGQGCEALEGGRQGTQGQARCPGEADQAHHDRTEGQARGRIGGGASDHQDEERRRDQESRRLDRPRAEEGA